MLSSIRHYYFCMAEQSFAKIGLREDMNSCPVLWGIRPLTLVLLSLGQNAMSISYSLPWKFTFFLLVHNRSWYNFFPEAICQILSISNNVVLSFSRIGSASFALSDSCGARRKCACGNVWWWRGVCVMRGVVLGASHFIAIYCNIIVLSDFAIKLQ